MRNFIAVLKDSFREAVDGFLIWLMLILSALAIFVIATINYDAKPAQESFTNLVRKFNEAFRLRGTDNVEVGTRIKIADLERTSPLAVVMQAENVVKTDTSTGVAGEYQFRLVVNKQSGTVTFSRRVASVLLSTDEFRMLIASWSSETPLEKEYVVKIPKVNYESGPGNTLKPIEDKNKEKELIKPEEVPVGMTGAQYIATKDEPGRYQAFTAPDVNIKQMKAVDTQTMIDFLKQQFTYHGDMNDVDVTRVEGIVEPEYQFDVTVRLKGVPKGWSYDAKMFFGAMPVAQPGTGIGNAIINVQDILVNTVGASIIFLVSVILTAFFIPNMLRKGAVDLLIVKPISRWQLLLYKYIGGCIFVFLIITFTIIGVWAVTWLRSGVMNPSFFLSIPFLTFTFSILYGVSMFVAVFTRSAIACIVITCLFMVLVWGVGASKSLCDISRNMPGSPMKTGVAFNTTVDILNAVLPRYNDLMKLNSRMMQQSLLTPADFKRDTRLNYPSWGEALSISMAWIVGLYLLSYWKFVTRDP